MSDELMFNDESSDLSPQTGAAKTWKVLIADDEQDIHDVTRMVLKSFKVEGCYLELYSAKTVQEAKKILDEQSDISVAILDMIMDTEKSGIELASYIREDQGNQYTRIVIRSGQPDQSVDMAMIERLDISDFKEKTELTTQRLKTLCYFLVKAYHQIRLNNRYRAGLETLVGQFSDTQSFTGFQNFASTLMDQVLTCLNLSPNVLLVLKNQDDWQSLIGKHNWANGKLALNPQEVASIESSYNSKSHFHDNQLLASYAKSFRGGEYVLLVKSDDIRNYSEQDRKMLYTCANHISIAFENLTGL